MKVHPDMGLSFDDVLLIPKKNSFGSRKKVSLKTKLTKKITLNIPIVSANMDTVTGSRLAIAMAQSGGIGILHRFNSIEDEVAEVKKVKRQSSYIIKDPYTITKDKTVGDAKAISQMHGVSGFPVLDQGKLVGIVTERDIWFQRDDALIADVMTKKKDMVLIEQEKSMKPEKFVEVFKKHKVEKIPIIDKKSNLLGMVTAKDIANLGDGKATKSRDGSLMVGASVGVKDAAKRADALIKAGADVLVIDIAHGHSEAVLSTLKSIKRKLDVEVIAGNIATSAASEELISAGADAIKVGIGPGSVCTTRLVAGSGVPQLTAIEWAYDVAQGYGVPIIGDGGIRTSGDIAKAIAAGASTVMVGKMLGGSEEAPGSTIIRGGRKYKFYRGMSSISANNKKLEVDQSDFDISDVVGEGNETFIPYVGSAKEIISQMCGGLRSAFSYSGATNISELRENAELIRLSPSSQRESYAKLDSD
jgi:IMP dehydrogenase